MMIKRMKKSLIICLCFVFGIAFSQQKKWTLQECVKHALEHNITVKRGENTLLVNNQDIKAARGQFLPSVSASSNHSTSVGVQRVDIGERQVFVDRTTNNTNIGIGANQTVFNGFRLTNLYKQSQLNLETNKLELERIKDGDK